MPYITMIFYNYVNGFAIWMVEIYSRASKAFICIYKTFSTDERLNYFNNIYDALYKKINPMVIDAILSNLNGMVHCHGLDKLFYPCDNNCH